jgi:bifunctional non-homologous end joining protein LigD
VPPPLAEYDQKRDFGRTPEPPGEERPRAAGGGPDGPLTFVVQKHAARRLHYDFRLEWDGVMPSWAIPKGPSARIGDRHLAVHVEDHPLDYQTFEGVIPKGEYGGGEVIVWDSGTYSPARAARSLRRPWG